MACPRRRRWFAHAAAALSVAPGRSRWTQNFYESSACWAQSSSIDVDPDSFPAVARMFRTSGGIFRTRLPKKDGVTKLSRSSCAVNSACHFRDLVQNLSDAADPAAWQMVCSIRRHWFAPRRWSAHAARCR